MPQQFPEEFHVETFQVYVNVVCPECGTVMMNSADRKTSQCMWTKCSRVNIEYNLPTIELTRAEPQEPG